jgi:ATP-dependent DNA ligase
VLADVAAEARRLACSHAIIDGKIVVLGQSGAQVADAQMAEVQVKGQ